MSTAEMVEEMISCLSQSEIENGKADRLRYIARHFPQIGDDETTIADIEAGMDQYT